MTACPVQLYVDGLPPGANGTFESSTINVPPGGSTSTKLTIATGAAVPPGHYPLTIRGVSGADTRMVPFGLGVTPPANFLVPEFSLDPDYAPAGYTDKQYKITFTGSGFPANQRVASPAIAKIATAALMPIDTAIFCLTIDMVL